MKIFRLPEDKMEIGGISRELIANTMSRAAEKSSESGFEKRLKAAMDAEDAKELKKVCREFEGIFLGMMYKQMKATVPKSGLFQSGAAQEIFESMLDEKLMEKAASSGGAGLGDMLYKQLAVRLKKDKE